MSRLLKLPRNQLESIWNYGIQKQIRRTGKLIDIGFDFKINETCESKLIEMVVLVFSYIEYEKERNIIRETWGKTKLFDKDGEVKIVFLLASTPSREVQARLEKESKEYQDIVQGNFVDSYRNLAYKNLMGIQWVLEFCPQAKFVVKTDDDIFLDLFEINFLVSKYKMSAQFNEGKFLLCPVLQDNDIKKDSGNKWFVQESDIDTFKLKNSTFPNFCTGLKQYDVTFEK